MCSMALESPAASKKSSNKRMRVSDDLGAQIQEQACKRARKVVLDAMDADPKVAFQIQYLIENKKLGKEDNDSADDDKLPACCNKWSLLKRERCSEILIAIAGDDCRGYMNEMPALELRKLLGFALSVEPTSALPSKSVKAIIGWAKARYDEMGKRCSGMVYVSDSSGKKVPNYNRKGVFAIVQAEDGSGSCLGLRHLNGQAVIWDTPRPATLALVDNHSEATTRLLDTATKMSCDVMTTFKEKGLEANIPMPTNEEKVAGGGGEVGLLAMARAAQQSQVAATPLPPGNGSSGSGAPAPPAAANARRRG